jgi:hypothetical protein
MEDRAGGVASGEEHDQAGLHRSDRLHQIHAIHAGDRIVGQQKVEPCPRPPYMHSASASLAAVTTSRAVAAFGLFCLGHGTFRL